RPPRRGGDPEAGGGHRPLRAGALPARGRGAGPGRCVAGGDGPGGLSPDGGPAAGQPLLLPPAPHRGPRARPVAGGAAAGSGGRGAGPRRELPRRAPVPSHMSWLVLAMVVQGSTVAATAVDTERLEGEQRLESQRALLTALRNQSG